jgi:hypothetical protein
VPLIAPVKIRTPAVESSRNETFALPVSPDRIEGRKTMANVYVEAPKFR